MNFEDVKGFLKEHLCDDEAVEKLAQEIKKNPKLWDLYKDTELAFVLESLLK